MAKKITSKEKINEPKDKIISQAEEKADVVNRLAFAYDIMNGVEKKVKNIKKASIDIMPTSTESCDIPEILQKVNNVTNDVTELTTVLPSALNTVLSEAQKLQNEVNGDVNTVIANATKKFYQTMDASTSIIINSVYVPFLAIQIVLKKYQIIQYELELTKTNLSITSAELTKDELLHIMEGKGDASDAEVSSVVSHITQAAVAINNILNIISSITTAISGQFAMNVNGAGMAFFPTPKSIIKTEILVANTNMSTTYSIPPIVDLLISEAETQWERTKGQIKNAKVAQMGMAGMNSVTSATGFNPGSFGELPQFDPQTIRTAIYAILQTLTEAEALPKYEKLNVTNIRFMTFLMTGFEPAGKCTFGIPGYP